jgi:type IV pilus assembly protein PilM
MSVLSSWLAAPVPDAAVEIAPGRVAAATMTSRASGLAMRAYATSPLADGAVTASLTSSNIADREAVSAALRSVLEQVGARGARVALVVPDLTSRVSVIRFEQVPARRDDLDQLVRWQMRKSAPFPIEDACVTYSPGRHDPSGGREFAVVAARKDIIREYEQACEAAGAQPGLVDIATFSLLNLVLASARAEHEDSLVVHMRPEYTSIAIVRGGDLIFFRNRPEGAEEALSDVVHQTAMYYQDRLSGRGFARVLLGGDGRGVGGVDRARGDLEARLGLMVEPIDWTNAAAMPESMRLTPEGFDLVAPLAGVLVRVHRETVHA